MHVSRNLSRWIEMSRLSRPNAFHGLLSWFCSSRLTELACKFCSRSLHAADPSYTLPKSHSKNIKQTRNGYCIHNIQCGCFSSARGSALETLPSHLHFGILVCLETKQMPACPGCNTSMCLTFISYFVIPFRLCTVILSFACWPYTQHYHPLQTD